MNVQDIIRILLTAAILKCCHTRLRVRRLTDITDFKEHPKDVVGEANSTVSLSCESIMSGSDYFWKLNGNYLDLEKSSNLYRTENGGKRLVIKSLDPSTTEGDYQCVARGASGSVISKVGRAQAAFIRVLGGAALPPSRSAVIGSHLLLKSIRIASRPDATYIWRRLDNGIWKNVSDVAGTYVTTNGDLFLPSVKLSTSYRLNVRNPLYEKNREFHLRSVSVTVTGSLPEGDCPDKTLVLVSPNQNVTVNIGIGSVTLECLVASKKCWSAPKVKWLLGGSQVRQGIALVINTPSKSDEKKYVCEAENNGVTARYEFWLKVRELPKWTNKPAKFVTLLGDFGLSPGTYNGANEVQWFVDGDEVTSVTTKHEITQDKVLKIKAVSGSEAGIYQVFIKNEAGTRTWAINVGVMNGCGKRVIGNSGEISLLSLLSSDATNCGWVIQVPFPGKVNFTFSHLKFNNAAGDCANTKLTLIEKSRASSTPIWSYCIWDKTPKPIPLLTGPDITFRVKVHPNYLKEDGGFTLRFRVHTLATTSAARITTAMGTLTPSRVETPLKQVKKEEGLAIWIIGLVAGLGALLIIVAVVICFVWKKRKTPSVPRMEANGNVETRKNPYSNVSGLSVKGCDSPSTRPILGNPVTETPFCNAGSRIAVSRTNLPTLSQSLSDPFSKVELPVYSVCDSPDYQNVSGTSKLNKGQYGTRPQLQAPGTPISDVYYQNSPPEPHDYEQPYESTPDRESECYDYPYEASDIMRKRGFEGMVGRDSSGNAASGVYQTPSDDEDESEYNQPNYDLPYEPSGGIVNQGFQGSPFPANQHLAVPGDSKAHEPGVYEPVENYRQKYAPAGPGDANYAHLNYNSADPGNYQEFSIPDVQRRASEVYQQISDGNPSYQESNYQALH